MTSRALALAFAVTLASCGGSLGPSFDSASLRDAALSPSTTRPAGATLRMTPHDAETTTPIKHVVFVIQENRSFNNLFAGFPGAKTAKYGYDKDGKRIHLRSTHLGIYWDLGHSGEAFYDDCHGTGKVRGTDCRNDGWNGELVVGNHPPNPAYTFVNPNDITPYWTMAKQYVLADEMFSSNIDGSFISHQYAVAASASHGWDYPSRDWGCEGGSGDTIATILQGRKIGPRIVVCFKNPTIGSEADAKKVSWRFYGSTPTGDGGLWSAYQAIHNVYYGPDWKADVISPQSRFLSDVRNGTLASITWITPTFETSDHPGVNSNQGPGWVASIVDAIGKSTFWNGTAIFIMWDDWGGFFDPVKPIYKDAEGLGYRVPLIIVSPYAKVGSVTHVQYETSSVLRFIEDDFGLGRLSTSDARAADPADDPAVFDFKQKPRKFKTIPGAKPPQYWRELEQSSTLHGIPPAILGDD